MAQKSKFTDDEILWFIGYFNEWHGDRFTPEVVKTFLPAFLLEYEPHDFELTSEAREAFYKFLVALED